jgi:hypothetical protein
MDDMIKILYNRLYNSDYDNKGSTIYLADLISEFTSNDVNFYPGEPDGVCCETGYFISLGSSLSSKIRLDKDQLISLDEMLKIMFKHIFIDCLEKTSNVILVCDEINTAIFNKYAAQFRALKRLNIKVQIVYFKQSGPQDITKLIMPS